MREPAHIPVLCKEVVEALGSQSAGRYIDGTLGDGGHAKAILEASAPGGRLLGLDADSRAITVAQKVLAAFADRVTLVHSNFSDIMTVAQGQGFMPVHGILLDLGWSSTQLYDQSRGFSFQQDGCLDMRYDSSQGLMASDLIDTLSQHELADLIWRYGEERLSRRIARAIVRERPISGTKELADLIERTIGRREKIHPATRTFQALRIAVNDELHNLEKALPQLPALLQAGGVLAIISFHSLEDRLVKQFLRKESVDCICPPATPACVCRHQARLKLTPRKAIRPDDEEVARNPRSRSARLRVARRLP